MSTEILEMPKQKKSHAFRAGLAQIIHKEYPKVKREIMDTLEIVNDNTYHKYARGERVFNTNERKAIEKIFRKYHVSAKKVWGEK